MQEDFIEVTVHYGSPTTQYLLSTLLHIHHAVREAHKLCIANWSCHTTNRHKNVDLTHPTTIDVPCSQCNNCS